MSAEQLDLFAMPDPARSDADLTPLGDAGMTPLVPSRRPSGRTTVVCLKGRQGDPQIADVVYVGRPMFMGGWRLIGHVLSNPFRIGQHGDAAAVVERYRTWLAQRPQLLARELPKLRGRQLGCWCPDGQPCHARVLAELADAEEWSP